ncbi:GNAT family N-acetyltransferase [Thiohalomonas denitrificans]|uniref:Putative acetyltransferase n=1 Tax=Thiohalomonas denitrificans TaxID=415747 RepID=A0A1G5R271_9GAMM|nr:GNAT family N-acetyltransferase [Thiohalomonas denitrificans]SCZ67910.1 putative acetyltransferase [Thiohalomonas denitrificans]
MEIRPYQDNDFEAVLACFNRSVREIAFRNYMPDEVEAWAPVSPDLDAWARRLETGAVFLAVVEGQVGGFVRVEESGYVDLLYVDPAHERKGIGRSLLEFASAWAVRHGAIRLESDVSISARPLFQLMGFRVTEERFVERRGVVLKNFRMEKNISAESVEGRAR